MKYYSEILNKVFDTEQDLKIAEKENEEKKLEVQLAKAKRAEKAKEVEEAYAKANEAYKEAQTKLNAFIKEYGSFHSTKTNILPDTRSLIDMMFDSFFIR